MLKGVPEGPRIYYELPEFTLTDQLGGKYGYKDLKNRIWVANFIYTSCPTICQELTMQMVDIQKKVRHTGDSVMLVSVSVDPENDTPEKLKAYGAKAGANPAKWRFVTGELDVIKKAVVEGFRQPMGSMDTMEDKFAHITHGGRFILVDPNMKIRGFYDGGEEGMKKLTADMSWLIAYYSRIMGSPRGLKQQ